MKKTKLRGASILSIIGFFVLMLIIVIFVTLKNNSELRQILDDSVEAQLRSITVAARGLIDAEKFDSYNSEEDVQNNFTEYTKTLSNLRSLQRQVGAQYIYALKLIDGKYCFVFDTDTVDEQIFIEYEIAPIHEQAFLGKEVAGVMNLTDEWGSYNTGAVPIWKDGKVIGIVCADIEDTFIQKSRDTEFINAIYLTVSVFAAMCVMTVVTSFLLRRVRAMQEKLFRMANYDVITNLPNRQYLMDYLASIASPSAKVKHPFALLFIDLDNFKKVNDNAGHDAGDELLHHIAVYLDTIHENSKAFRPSAGILNVSARIGGDEFVQIVPGVADEAEAEIVAKKVLDHFGSNTLNRFIEKYQVGLSIGVAVFPYHTDNYNVLIKYADIAMYHAKNGGKNSYRVYNEDMAQKNEK